MLDRLMGPSDNVCYTQDSIRPSDRKKVVVVSDDDLRKLEKYFELPIHQQIKQMETTVRQYMKETEARGYPVMTFLLALANCLSLAHDLAFAHFVTGLEVTEVVDV